MVVGTAGFEVLLGYDGNDSLSGDAGADRLEGGSGADRLDGGADDDTASYQFAPAGLFAGLEDTGFNTGDAAGDTYVDVEHLSGTAFNDTLYGNGANNRLFGLGGNDTMVGKFGADTFDGGIGDDRVSYDASDIFGVRASLLNPSGNTFAAAGDTYISIENLAGSSGNDVLQGNNLANRLEGNAYPTLIVDNDQLSGAGGADRLFGYLGNDTLSGDAGDDFLDGGAGTDTLRGGADNDTYALADASDTVEDSGGAADRATTTITRSLLAVGLTTIENLTLLSGNINGTGNNLNNLITGSAGANTLAGGVGTDTLDGGAGNDVLDGGLGTDTLRGGTESDTYVLADGADTVQDTGGTADLATTTITRSLLTAGLTTIENLTLLAGNINGTGNNLSNLITGSAGNNILTGGAGADRLRGGLGNDTYHVDSAADQVVEAGGAGTDTVLTTASHTLAAGQAVETLRVEVATSSNAVNLTGNALANTIIGNNGANVLRGGGGADKLSGLLGNDIYVLENGAAQVSDTGGVDLVTSTITRSLLAAGLTTLENLTLISGNINGTGNNLNNGITGSAGANVLTGGVGNDTLRGLAGNDTLIGGVGIDTLTGGTQNDVFVFNAPLNVANRDVITDFANAAGNNDSIHLDNAVMAALGAPGALKANFFFAGAAAHDADDRVIYNKASGALSYDTNGNAAGGVTLLATLTTKPTLTAADFAVI
jgi:Ca2+-binding RTX toxin-like protein